MTPEELEMKMEEKNLFSLGIDGYKKSIPLKESILISDAIEIAQSYASSMCKREWISVEDRLPEETGCYLCISNDNWQMVCFINSTGNWMLRPGGSFYGDLCGADKHLGIGKKRKIVAWQPLPSSPLATEEVSK